MDDLHDLIDSLSPGEQESVREFISFLKTKHDPEHSPFLSAVDEFMKEHPELLRRLAQ